MTEENYKGALPPYNPQKRKTKKQKRQKKQIKNNTEEKDLRVVIPECIYQESKLFKDKNIWIPD